MERGDLAAFTRNVIVVVLEGVLFTLTEASSEKRRFRAPKISVYHLSWHELAMKRLLVIRDRYPEIGITIVTFVSEDLLEVAATYLTAAHIPYDEASFEHFGNWTNLLKFRPEVKAVYDSDWERLQSYGQLGVSVVRGEDF